MAERGHRVTVVTLFPGGFIASDLDKIQGVKLIPLWSRRNNYLAFRLFQILFSPLALRRLTSRGDSLYSMLEITNFIAWLATRYKKNVSLIWGIRSSDSGYHWKMALFDRLCAFISPSINLLIANSCSGMERLLERGYRPKRYAVISNGIDTGKFRYNSDARKSIRRKLGISADQPLIGVVARLDPVKDHPTFLRAAAHLADKEVNARFLCVGSGADRYAEELCVLANKLGLRDRVIWFGEQRDMVAIYSALDVVVSSSCSEGFSNTIGEAMSCGVPCVVTDVGDSARIVGNQLRVVEPGSPEKLADAIHNTLQEKVKPGRGGGASPRIEKKYSVQKVIDLKDKNLNGDHAVD